MRLLPLLVIIASASLALGSPLSAQAPEPALTFTAPATTATVPALELRIEEARQSYRHNRHLGNGLVAAGAAVVVGALADWAAQDRLGMGTSATGLMFGGISLAVWGADRRAAAHDALRRAEAWEAQLESTYRPH